ncbi:MAG: hypothetical protein K2M60_10760 [Lachnospiraceae bacterium]|nr:hypothetical protein [Lachnospiraceae bacterium]MDE6252246.1 hypothetical protein [Lachnospiraceae bacterium]
MAELVFIEGISGVGKSTMVHMLSEELQNQGYVVKKYVEFDYENPLDFYCTAYFTLDKYERLCAEYKSFVGTIHSNTINAGNVRLVRYYNGDIPLFEEPLLSELCENEFCYKPNRLVPIKEYTSVYKEVWSNYASALDETYDFIILDGSLLHHPINDMMRNYKIIGEQAISHVTALLCSLGLVKRHIFYLKTDDISRQLKKAHCNRGQSVPTDNQIKFWEMRYKNDLIVLNNMQEDYKIYDISYGNYDLVRKQIVDDLIYRKKTKINRLDTNF